MENCCVEYWTKPSLDHQSLDWYTAVMRYDVLYCMHHECIQRLVVS